MQTLEQEESRKLSARYNWEIIFCYTRIYCVHTLRGRISSVHFSHSVVSDSFWPQGLQHTRLPCPSPTPGAFSNSCPLSQWCHATISSSVAPFSSCLQSFPASGSFPMSQFFTSGGQSIGTSASAPVLPMNIQGWFPLEFGVRGYIFVEMTGKQPPDRIWSSRLDEVRHRIWIY